MTTTSIRQLDKWEQAIYEFLRRQPSSEYTRWSDIQKGLGFEGTGEPFQAAHRLVARGLIRLRHGKWEATPR